MASNYSEQADIETTVEALIKAKGRFLEEHRRIEALKLPGVHKELHNDLLRAVRGSVAYLDVVVSEVYASGDCGGGPFFEGTAVGALGTAEFDHAVFDEEEGR